MRDEHRRGRVRRKRDRHRRGRGIPVAIDDLVLERHRPFLTNRRNVGESAVAVILDAAAAIDRTRHQADAGGEVHSVGASRVIDQDADRHRSILGALRRAVVTRCRSIVDDRYDQAGVRGIAVAVRHRDGEGLGLDADDIRRHRGQLVGVSVAGARAAGHGQGAVGAVDRPAVGHVDTFDEETSDRVVAGGDHQAAGGELTVRSRVGADRQGGLRNLRVGALRDKNDRPGIGCERDRHGRHRGVPVAIDDLVLESDCPFLASRRNVGERAVAVILDASAAGHRTGHQADAGGEIDAIGAECVVDQDADRHRSILGALRRIVVARCRNVVDDVDDKIGVRRIAVAVGHRDRERVGLGAGDVGRHRGQLVGISVTRRRAAGHRQGPVGAVHGPAVGHVSAVDEQSSDRVVARGDHQRARGELAIGTRVRADRKRRFVDLGIRAVRNEHRRRGIGRQRDRYSRNRGIPVPVDDLVLERHRPFLASRRNVGERAVAVILDASAAGHRTGHQADAGGEIDAIGAECVVDQDADRHRSILGALRRIVVARCRNVVDDVDDQGSAVGVAVAVGDDNIEFLGGGVAGGIVGEDEVVADRVGLDAGDRQHTGGRDDRLPDTRDGRPVDADRRWPVNDLEPDRARSDLGRCLSVRAGRLVIAGRQTRFRNDGSSAGLWDEGDDRWTVANRYRQGRGRSIAVAVGQPIGEDIGHATRRVGRANIRVAARGIDRERAVLAGDDRRP